MAHGQAGADNMIMMPFSKTQEKTFDRDTVWKTAAQIADEHNMSANDPVLLAAFG